MPTGSGANKVQLGVPSVPEGTDDDLSPTGLKRGPEGGVGRPTKRQDKAAAAGEGVSLVQLEELLAKQTATFLQQQKQQLDEGLKDLELRTVKRIEGVQAGVDKLAGRADAAEERVQVLEKALADLTALVKQGGGTSAVGRVPKAVDERRKGTLVFGGWPRESKRVTILTELAEALKKVDLLGAMDDKPFCTGPRRSVVLLNMPLRQEEDDQARRQRMFSFVTRFQETEITCSAGTRLWCSFSKSPEERAVAGHASWVKRTVQALPGGHAADLEFEYKTGTVWMDQGMVASARLPFPPKTDIARVHVEEDNILKPWVNVGLIAQVCGVSPRDVGEVYGWNVGGADMPSLADAVRNGCGGTPKACSLIAIQEMPRGEPGWRTEKQGLWTLITCQPTGEWRGQGVAFQDEEWTVLQRVSAGKGIWLRLRHLISAVTVWIGSAHFSPGCTQAQYEEQVDACMKGLPPSPHPVIFQCDANAPIEWAEFEGEVVAVGKDGKANELLGQLDRRGLRLDSPPPEQYRVPTSRPRQDGREGNIIDYMGSCRIVCCGLRVHVDSCHVLGTDHELLEGTYEVRATRKMERYDTRARTWTGSLPVVHHVDQDTLVRWARTYTRPKQGLGYRDPPGVKRAVQLARFAKTRKTWTEVRRLRKIARQAWEADRIKRASHGDWKAIRSLRPQSGYGWQQDFADASENDPHNRVHKHLAEVYRGPGVAPNSGVFTGPTQAFTVEELDVALGQMQGGKAVGVDATSKELLQGVARAEGGREHLAEFFTRILVHQQIPEDWNTPLMVLLPKVLHPKDVKQLRPISMGSSVSKLFSRLLLNRTLQAIALRTHAQCAGAVESPSIFEMVAEICLEEADERYSWEKDRQVFPGLAQQDALFMDDGLLCKKGTPVLERRVRQLQVVLAEYGLRLNGTKCQLLCSPHWAGTREITIAGEVVKASETVEVMGLPMKVGLSICELVAPLIARARAKFWGLKHIFRAKTGIKGRLQTMAKIVGNRVPEEVVAVFGSPYPVCALICAAAALLLHCSCRSLALLPPERDMARPPYFFMWVLQVVTAAHATYPMAPFAPFHINVTPRCGRSTPVHGGSRLEIARGPPRDDDGLSLVQNVTVSVHEFDDYPDPGWKAEAEGIAEDINIVLRNTVQNGEVLSACRMAVRLLHYMRTRPDRSTTGSRSDVEDVIIEPLRRHACHTSRATDEDVDEDQDSWVEGIWQRLLVCADRRLEQDLMGRHGARVKTRHCSTRVSMGTSWGGLAECRMPQRLGPDMLEQGAWDFVSFMQATGSAPRPSTTVSPDVARKLWALRAALSRWPRTGSIRDYVKKAVQDRGAAFLEYFTQQTRAVWDGPGCESGALRAGRSYGTMGRVTGPDANRSGPCVGCGADAPDAAGWSPRAGASMDTATGVLLAVEVASRVAGVWVQWDGSEDPGAPGALTVGMRMLLVIGVGGRHGGEKVRLSTWGRAALAGTDRGSLGPGDHDEGVDLWRYLLGMDRTLLGDLSTTAQGAPLLPDDRRSYMIDVFRGYTLEQQQLMTVAFITVIRSLMSEIGELSHLASMVEVELDGDDDVENGPNDVRRNADGEDGADAEGDGHSLVQLGMWEQDVTFLMQKQGTMQDLPVRIQAALHRAPGIARVQAEALRRRLRLHRGPVWAQDDLFDAVEALLVVVIQAGENEAACGVSAQRPAVEAWAQTWWDQLLRSRERDPQLGSSSNGPSVVEMVDSGTTDPSEESAVDRLLQSEAEERDADQRDGQAMADMQARHEEELAAAVAEDRRAWEAYESKRARDWDDWAMHDEMNRVPDSGQAGPLRRRLYMVVETSQLRDQQGVSRSWRFPLSEPGAEPVRVTLQVEQVLERDPEHVETIMVPSPGTSRVVATGSGVSTLVTDGALEPTGEAVLSGSHVAETVMEGADGTLGGGEPGRLGHAYGWHPCGWCDGRPGDAGSADAAGGGCDKRTWERGHALEQ
ncbi:unnamed protein product [Symbiodinium sp. CCMP2456]|nr:unnamed protein product [Symbiodinium sp. CCMP2456]